MIPPLCRLVPWASIWALKLFCGHNPCLDWLRNLNSARRAENVRPPRVRWNLFLMALMLPISICGWSSAARAESPTVPIPAADAHPLVWDALEKFARKEGMNETAFFEFWVTNASAAAAAIVHTESSCDCTVATLPSRPWVLKPGESGALRVKMNLLGRHGRVTKEIFVGTSHGGQVLKVQVDIPLTPAPFNVSARQRDVLAAQKDRQAVFSGGCAACHAWPAAGRTGQALFAKACDICHGSEQRAAFVPDLATLKHATPPDYWRTWITHGKPGSLMPAFGRPAGGILDTHQIESLVSFLETNYPSRKALEPALPQGLPPSDETRPRINSPVSDPTP